MSGGSKTLSFLWWNVQSLAHFIEERASDSRWPTSAAEYASKCVAIDRAFDHIIPVYSPDIVFLGEVTSVAAQELRQRKFPKYKVHSLDILEKRPQQQVAVLYRSDVGFEVQDPVIVPLTPRGTRPIAVVDYIGPRDRIRFFGCHWTARFAETSEKTREDIASFLNREIFVFMANPAKGESRHVVVVGDMNTEPFGMLENRMHAFRDRGSSRRKHYTDGDTRRARLYNCAWRFLGEKKPHAGEVGIGSIAGTLFWREKNSWHTFDHIIVSGSLLSDTKPFLNEASVNVVVDKTLLGSDDRPMKFFWRSEAYCGGVSDHLPVSGTICLLDEDEHANLRRIA